MRDGATAGFKYFNIKDVRGISVKVRGIGKGELHVSTRIDGETVAQIQTSPAQEWGIYKAPLQISKGVNALYFTYKGEGAIDLLSFIIE